jgi:hypothetical protein
MVCPWPAARRLAKAAVFHETLDEHSGDGRPMKTGSQLTWNQLLAEAFETFKILARNRLRGGEMVMADEWYDIAAEAAERATPRREVRLLEVLLSQPALMARSPGEETGSLGEAAFVLVREALQDEIAGRMNSLQAEVVHGRNVPLAPESDQALKDATHAHPAWEAFTPRLEEAFMLRVKHDLAADMLPRLHTAPEAVARYIDSFAREAMPEDLDEIVALIASSPALAARPPAAARTFEGCASQVLEEAIAEHLADLYKRLREEQLRQSLQPGG